ncbi:hypothetical protein [Ramlibacter sp.]|uniref:hypothetical protein n=1 Tax=Ramlibacter sp. TaxID=1917967 RepID=UPI0026231997|nr:hypothetical protein [Ramlibacter sp.]MDB5957692.1 hypothetical protein [Ramlibacter sp.]
MATKQEIFDLLIGRTQSQLKGLDDRHNQLLDQLADDPALLDQTGDTAPATEMMLNRAQAGSLQQQLVGLVERRDDAAAHAAEDLARSRREQFRDDTVTKADRLRANAQRRVKLGEAADKALRALGAALEEIHSLNAQIRRDGVEVARLAHIGVPNEGHRHGDAVAHLGNEIEGAAANALVHMLLHHGIGTTGIRADLLFGNLSGAVHAESIEGAFECAANRIQQLSARWMHSAFGPSEAHPPQTLRVRATKEGWDGLHIRTVGEIFDFEVIDEHEIGSWMELAEGAELTKPPPPPALTLDQLRQMNPGGTVREVKV